MDFITAKNLPIDIEVEGNLNNPTVRITAPMEWMKTVNNALNICAHNEEQELKEMEEINGR